MNTRHTIQQTLLGRRGFLRAIGVAAASRAIVQGLSWHRVTTAPNWREARTLRLAFISSAARPNAGRAAQFGADEAAHAARMFGATVELEIDDSPERLLENGAHVLIGGFDEAQCRRLGDIATEHGALFLNVGCSTDALRRACRRSTFHVAASDAMRRDALLLAQAPAATTDDVHLWHESLERYGAGQVNARFRAQHSVGMDSTAWALWFATKAATEAFLRIDSESMKDLADRLRAPNSRFDGHKGRPLSFRPWDHQLRQPLYIFRATDDETQPTEVPDRGAGTAADQLDQLGATPKEACQWRS